MRHALPLLSALFSLSATVLAVVEGNFYVAGWAGMTTAWTFAYISAKAKK